MWPSTAVAIVIAVCSALAAVAGQPGRPDKNILVGVNYFAGWWDEQPNKWHGHGWAAAEPDWRPNYPDRVPLLGSYNDQATMDREIVAAAEHGVDFFSILWYFPAPGSKQEADCKRLNRGLENFLRSPHADRLRFILEYCNHAQMAATSDAQWDRCVTIWAAAMRHRSCLRVGGRLVFKVHDAGGFWAKRPGRNPLPRPARRTAAGGPRGRLGRDAHRRRPDEPIAGDRRHGDCQALRFHRHLHEHSAG